MKQETLEEAFDRIFDSIDYVLFDYTSFEQGAKWQQENSNENALEFEIKALKSLIQDMDATIKSKYSEEDLKSAFKVGFSIGYGSDVHAIDEKNITCNEWFEKFKKK
jgi:hypothetical protein